MNIEHYIVVGTDNSNDTEWLFGTPVRGVPFSSLASAEREQRFLERDYPHMDFYVEELHSHAWARSVA